MTTFIIITLGLVMTFCLGVLAGNRWSEIIGDARSRRQAARERNLNDQTWSLREQWALLHERQEAFEEEMRWHAKRQAGLVVLDHEPIKDAGSGINSTHRQSQ
jgi:hypothetical protein